MTFRYALRRFDAGETAEALLEDLDPPSKRMGSSLGRGASATWRAVCDTLRELGARTLLVQRGVRDPDFEEEHHAFYSKQHRPVTRMCVRVHVFSDDSVEAVGEPVERQVLSFLETAAERSSYLGFVTLRPLRHAPVGASILRSPPGRRAKAKDTFPVHIAGLEFTVSGTPFLQQDNAVGACAQASIWMALRTLRRRQGNAAFSPAELTVAATRYLASDRTFPGRQGLTISQMLEAVRFAGHDPLHLSITVDPVARPAQVAEVLGSAGPYIESGLPVILALGAPSGGHAVVAIGQDACLHRARSIQWRVEDSGLQIDYQPASNWCTHLTIHNDNSGPYLPLGPLTSPPAPYHLEHTMSLIVPLPDGIFMTAAEAEVLAVRFLTRVALMFSVAATGTPTLPTVPFVLRPVLVSRHAFRIWAKGDADMDRLVSEKYRTHELPAYVWLVEIHDAGAYAPGDPDVASRRGEIVLDAAADPLHADGLIFATVSSSLWHGVTNLPGLLYVEEEEKPVVIGLQSVYRGRRIVRSW